MGPRWLEDAHALLHGQRPPNDVRATGGHGLGSGGAGVLDKRLRHPKPCQARSARVRGREVAWVESRAPVATGWGSRLCGGRNT